MSGSSGKGWAAAVLVLGLSGILVAGCSGVARRVGTRYLTRQVDDVFDLDDAQEDQVHASIERLIETLPPVLEPDLSQLVGRVDHLIAHGASEASLEDLERQGDALADRVATQVIAELVPLLTSLSDAQIAHGHAWAEQRLQQAREKLQAPSAERLAKRQEAFIDSVETWTGDLSDAQEAALRARVAAEPDESRVELTVAERRVQSLEHTLRAHSGPEAVRVELLRLWNERDDLMPDGPSREERRARARQTLLFVDGMVTPAQRAHAREHLADEDARLRRFLGGG